MREREYWVGPPGAGKSSALTQKLAALIESGVRPDRILVLVPQTSAGWRFERALATLRTRTRGQPFIGTVYSLARRHVALFFPIIAERAGFPQPWREPTFINVEAAQYVLSKLAQPHLAEFNTLRLPRARVLSQIIDGLNKAAVAGFSLDEIAQRLSLAWSGNEPREPLFRRVQALAQAFRAYCMHHTLLDFSLALTLFAQYLLAEPAYRQFIAARFRHVLADNIEESPPVLHDFLGILLQTCDSAYLVEDDPGGYRLFLGADVDSARALRAQCTVRQWNNPRLAPDAPDSPARFGVALMQQVRDPYSRLPTRAYGSVTLVGGGKYWVEMVKAVAQAIQAEVENGTPPSAIAVLAPYAEDVLRFELEERLRPAGIRVHALRPSRPLHDHPVVRALITWARLAHPDWEQTPTSAELARAMSVSIAQLDLVRAHLLAEALHRAGASHIPMPEEQRLWQRVGMAIRERYAQLRAWLLSWRETPRGPLDVFWQLLFTEVLSQSGFGLFADRSSAVVCEQLIRNARLFREALVEAALLDDHSAGREYVSVLTQGVLAAQFAPERIAWQADLPPDPEAVLLAPAYAFLTNDLRADVQFWLDVNSTGWHERIYQPLTHPYVLSRRWRGDPWTDADELHASRDMLARVVGGLAFRCGKRIYLAYSQLTVSGEDENGQLLRAVQRVLLAAETQRAS
ncbi:MAG: hypothetical protein N2545_07445 [Thermoflexales bacterium]|nr:hypothetical protein [Thermoflexales bacterium]